MEHWVKTSVILMNDEVILVKFTWLPNIVQGRAGCVFCPNTDAEYRKQNLHLTVKIHSKERNIGTAYLLLEIT
jgi:hypothetical protein